MLLKIEKIPCNFVGNFKVGDNLVFNCQILSNLVSVNNDDHLNKPIVLQVGSILEASLSEVIYRAQKNNREGVPTISEQDRLEIEDKKIDKFNVVIDVLKKYKVLHSLDTNIYEELHKLRKYRNKIHIQDDINIEDTSKDEKQAFTCEICHWSLNLNKRVIKYLSEHLCRPVPLHVYSNQLSIPVLEPQDSNDNIRGLE